MQSIDRSTLTSRNPRIHYFSHLCGQAAPGNPVTNRAGISNSSVFYTPRLKILSNSHLVYTTIYSQLFNDHCAGLHFMLFVILWKNKHLSASALSSAHQPRPQNGSLHYHSLRKVHIISFIFHYITHFKMKTNSRIYNIIKL